MTTVKIYKITREQTYMADEQGEGYSLEQWGNDTLYYKGYDDGGKEYQLPEGYEVAKTVSGDLAIYDASGNYCDLFTQNGKPAIVTPSGNIIELAQ